MRGAPPKPEALRQRRNRKSSATVLQPAGDVQVPPLPLDQIWSVEVQEAWIEWWSSPMAAQWLPADAHGLLMMAVLLQDAISSESTTEKLRCLGELRHWATEYGISPLARTRLHWSLAKPDQEREQRALTQFDGVDPRARLGRQQESMCNNVVPLPVRESA